MQYQDHRTEHFYPKVFRSMILPQNWACSIVSFHIHIKIIWHEFQSTQVVCEGLGFHKWLSKRLKCMNCASSSLTFAGLRLLNYHKNSWNRKTENCKVAQNCCLERDTIFIRGSIRLLVVKKYGSALNWIEQLSHIFLIKKLEKVFRFVICSVLWSLLYKSWFIKT